MRQYCFADSCIEKPSMAMFACPYHWQFVPAVYRQILNELALLLIEGKLSDYSYTLWMSEIQDEMVLLPIADRCLSYLQ